MTFKEYLNQTTERDWFLAFPNFYKYVSKRFANFEILYVPTIFDDLLSSAIFGNTLELKKIENIINSEIFANKAAWGTISTSESNNTNSATSANSLNYSGFDNTGEFSSDNTTSNNSGTGTGKNVNLDELATTMTLAGTSVKNLYKEISKEILNLLKIVYNNVI